ncbi:hypothetical protein HDV05_006227 [Chytridiales sp. JEL 0842]|nr:hypothetical protein HDV05_006227 [Chytridiales sp. JEL 0842]
MSTLTFPKEAPLPPIGSALISKHSQQLDQPHVSSNAQLHHQQSSANTNTAANTNTIEEGASFSTKLTNVEAQRIMSVLQEAQKKVLLIGFLPDVVDRRVSTVLGADAVALIQDHKVLEQRFKSLNEAKEAGEKTDSGIRIEEQIKEVSKQLRASTRALCRHFSQNPTALNKLRYLKSSKPNTVIQFEHLLQEVKVLVYERLKTTVEEEKLRQDQLSVIVTKEQKTSNEVKALKEELDRAKKERTTEISKRNEVIRRLKDELREIKQQAEESTKRLESRSKQKEEQDLQLAREKELNLRQEISNIKAQLMEATQKNREEEALLRKKKFKIESEVENWIHKYDQDMEEKQAELEDVTAIFLEEKAQLDELQSRYNELQKEYDRIMEERRIAQEAKKEQEKQLRRMIDAATLIQAIWRGFAARMALKRKGTPPEKKKK